MENQKLETIRCFFAVEIDVEHRQRIVALAQKLQKQTTPHSLRCIPEENIHITLRFMGAALREKLPDMIQAVETALKNIKPFHITLLDAKPFPPNRYAKVIALDVEPVDEMQDLHERINDALVTCDIPKEERKLQPHLSIARLKEHHVPQLDTDLAKESLKQTVNHIVLFESQPSEGGVKYVPLHRFEL